MYQKDLMKMENVFRISERDFSHHKNAKFKSDGFNKLFLAQFPLKKSQDSECVVSGALALTLRISKLFGLAPLSFERQHGKTTIRFSPTWRIINCIFGTMMTLMLATAALLDSFSDSSDAISLLSKSKILATQIAVTTLMTTCGVFVSRAWTITMIRTLYCLKKINSKLNNIGPRKEWKKYAYFAFAFLTLLMILLPRLVENTSEISLNDKVSMISGALYILHYIDTIRSPLLHAQCVLVVTAINETLAAVNKILDQLLRTTQANDYKANPCTALGTIRRAYLSFCSVCDVLNQYERSSGLLYLAIIFSFFVHLILTLYRIVVAINCPIAFEYFAMIVLQCFHLVMNMIFLIEPCHRIEKQVKDTRVLVSQLMSEVTLGQGQVGAQLELFYAQFSVNRINITPMGMFTVTRPLILTILGTMTTYLVIVVQFQADKLCTSE